jgi:hypothetical protein
MKYYKNTENEVYAFEDSDGLPRFEGDEDYYRIPDTLTPISQEEADILRQPPLPTPDELETAFSALVTARLNAFAAEKQYDDITSARLAALSGEFQADGQAAQVAYDVTWTAAIALMPDVRSGEITVEQAVEQLPVLTCRADASKKNL